MLSYVEYRIQALRNPIEEEIEATATGEVLKIEDHGAYALVRKHPPNPDSPGVNTDRVALYHVRREPHVDGTESLHWAYLGDVHNSEQIRCGSCGGHLDKDASICPHCGSEHVDRPETED
ncbi:zinc ribbon domain-containing protein [Haloferax mediterranei ATCC 33500]|uniref:Zinc ribbon domain-containing protein n=2 Tax=Haloferacaceae TaxID=1644056 RepID=A0A4P8P7S5_HALMT|nr:zinc ribbon domain-containing protein [Haloferax mediterranei ATCC 33500]